MSVAVFQERVEKVIKSGIAPEPMMEIIGQELSDDIQRTIGETRWGVFHM